MRSNPASQLCFLRRALNPLWSLLVILSPPWIVVRLLEIGDKLRAAPGAQHMECAVLPSEVYQLRPSKALYPVHLRDMASCLVKFTYLMAM